MLNVYLVQNITEDFLLAYVLYLLCKLLRVAKDVWVLNYALLEVVQRKVKTLLRCPEVSTEKLTWKHVPGLT